MLVRSRWGQGLMSEVLPMLVRFGFEQLGLHRIEARVEPEHGASVRLLRKLGFTDEGLLRERTLHADGSRAGLALLGLLRHEYRG